MKLSVSAASYVGCVRNNNEDMVLVDHEFVRDGNCRKDISLDSTDRCILALADGMGGHYGGEVASSDVLHNLDFFFSDLPVGRTVEDFNEAIYDWLASVNHMVDSKGRSMTIYHNMGTTLVAFVHYGGEFYWMNCGDSRIYRFHNGRLKQLSTDHSLNVLMGSAEHTSQITNCIGGGCKTSYIDLLSCTKDVMPGDMFMLCSDGLTDMIDDKTIERLLGEQTDAEALCQAAVDAGGYDNVSVCLITVKQ